MQSKPLEFKIVLQQVKDDGSCFWGCFCTQASNNDKSFAKNGYSLRKEAGVSTSWFVLMFLSLFLMCVLITNECPLLMMQPDY